MPQNPVSSLPWSSPLEENHLRGALVQAVLTAQLAQWPQDGETVFDGTHKARQDACWEAVDAAALALASKIAPRAFPSQPGLQAVLAAAIRVRADQRAKPDPGSCRVLLRAAGTVITSTGPHAGETVRGRAMWSHAFAVRAELVIAWKEHGGDYEATLATAKPDGDGEFDVSKLFGQFLEIAFSPEGSEENTETP